MWSWPIVGNEGGEGTAVILTRSTRIISGRALLFRSTAGARSKETKLLPYSNHFWRKIF